MKHKRLYRNLAAGALCLAALYLGLSGAWHRPGLLPAHREPNVRFRTHGPVLQIKDGQGWQDFTPVGVNMGTGYPGVFPNESGIDRETYYRWFTQIGEMNANTIRVYQLQTPGFYSALLDYNRQAEKPIYLLQGVDFPEPLMYSQDNIMEPQAHRALFEDTLSVVNAVHGDHVVAEPSKNQLHIYQADVSPYLLGYVLGVEWDEMYVEYICRINEGSAPYSGDYLTCTDEANPFESFLAQWGDHLLRHEVSRYGTQPLVSFSNWPDTDPMKNELYTEKQGAWQKRRETPVDVDHIRATSRTGSGIFASYNVYPYFPSFLQHGTYAAHRDENGNSNPYLAYLTALTEHHEHPVVITEYGVPASRSRAYGEIWRQFTHGGLTELQQGQAMVALFRDIQKAGCAGSLVFTWQDEWYKTIWNDKLISDPDRRAFWSNAQCAEQFFGLLAFEPGEKGKTCYPDGVLSDWEGVSPVFKDKKLSLSMQEDEKYLYFLVRSPELGKQPLNIALDTLDREGVDQVAQLKLGRKADFVIRLDPQGNSGIYVDKTYDLLTYSALGGYEDTSLHSKQLLTLPSDESAYPGQSELVLVSRADGDIYNRMSNRWIINPVGRLTAGNANPDSPDYASNADYCAGDGFVELRIPWQLLNFTDPSLRMIADRLSAHHSNIRNLEIEELYVLPWFDGQTQASQFVPYPLEGWKQPQWHERLKQSYYILQEEFKGAN